MKQRRKDLQREVNELRSKLGAAAGETRKNLRERIARLSKEKDELEVKLKEQQPTITRLQNRVVELEGEVGVLRSKVPPEKGVSAP